MNQQVQVEGAVKSDLNYLDRCGEAGREWFQEIRKADAVKLFRAIEDALALARKRSIEEGFRIFGEVEAAADEAAASAPALVYLLRRHLYAARAYGHYLNNDLDAAQRDLRLARESLRLLVGLHSFLSPLAMGFTDFLIQRARMARRQNRWKEAQECLDELRGIYTGTVAFCTLESGRRLFIDDIRQLGRTLDLTDEQRDWFRRLIGDNTNVESLVDGIETTVYTLPDQVIPYH